jgi:hypothetical protein
MFSWSDLPPTQAGLAAALKAAFDLPENGNARQFEELLRRLH